MKDAYEILSAWIRLEHDGARRRQGVSFRAARDMQDLWQWITRDAAS